MPEPSRTDRTPEGAALTVADATRVYAGIPTEQGTDPYADDAALLDLFTKTKRECFSQKYIYERAWLRNLYYILGKQWITYHPRRGWIEKRLATWVPRPVTDKIGEGVQALVAMFSAIKLGVICRPNGQDPTHVVTADVADELEPLIHGEHNMDANQREEDFWLAATGNAFKHVYWDKNPQHGVTFVADEVCAACDQVYKPQQILDARQSCPQCGGTQFIKADTGERIPKGKGQTRVFSPFDIGVPQHVVQFDDVDRLIVRRWRTRTYYEDNYPELAKTIVWERAPSDEGSQALRAIAAQSEVVGIQSSTFGGGATAEDGEGATEYELWMKPSGKFDKGLLARFVSDAQPVLIRDKNESIPGPLPYTDIEGTPLWSWVHTIFEKVGGRLWGRSPIDRVIQKQDQVNQLDSLIQMWIQRCASPHWKIPKNAQVSKFTGAPGVFIEWDALALNGMAEPKLEAGIALDQSLFAYREQLLKDIEEGLGTFDIVKGQKPTGVEAFSALQLLVERSQSRFATVFSSRGEGYRRWYALALELERQFGPTERIKATMGPNRQYSFGHFQRAQLQGSVTIVVEDGTNVPKTSLGQRASMQDAVTYKILNFADPDTLAAGLSMLGLSHMAPGLDAQVEAAQQVQQAFEDWVRAGGAQQAVEPSIDPMTGLPVPVATPLDWKPWHQPQIHLAQRMRWLNGDVMRDLIKAVPQIEPILIAHLQQLQMMTMPPSMPSDQGAAGKGQALATSRRESTTDLVPSGANQGAQRQGPV